MKTLQLCLSDGKGGLELYVLKVIKWLKEGGRDFHVVALSGSFLDQSLDEVNIPCSHNKTTLQKFPIISAFPLARLIEKEKIDIVHMHWGKDLPLASLAKRLSKRPVKLVYTRHMEIPALKKNPYHAFLYSQVDTLITITEALHLQAAKCLPLPADKITLIHHGVPVGKVENKASMETFREKAGLSKTSFKVALFGRIEEGKGQHLLIKAVQEVVGKGRDLEAVLIGLPMDENYLASLMEDVRTRGLSERIHYYGFHKHPMEIMGCFDVVVLASYNETFGLVLIEAMRQGVAVIGSNAGGVPEIIDDNETGLLFETRNYKSLALKLERLIDDPSLCEELARKGKAKADKLFSEERHFEELENLYRATMSS